MGELQAPDRGTPQAAKRALCNTIADETWVESAEAPDWQRLADRREALTMQRASGLARVTQEGTGSIPAR